MSSSDLESLGFTKIRNVIDQLSLEALSGELECFQSNGFRRVLDFESAGRVVRTLFDDQRLQQHLESKVAVQCTFFEKSVESNWLVPTHRDCFIHVKEKFEAPGWSGWSVKEGIDFVSPPRSVLEQCLAIRVHVDDSLAENGAMEVSPGSHSYGSKTDSLLVEASAGDALVFRPLILHRSSKSKKGRRRVLQFLFGPEDLPVGAEWFYKISRNV